MADNEEMYRRHKRLITLIERIKKECEQPSLSSAKILELINTYFKESYQPSGKAL